MDLATYRDVMAATVNGGIGSPLPKLKGYREVIANLDAVSRRRALTLRESMQLERAIKTEQSVGELARRRAERRRGQNWEREEDELLRQLLGEGQTPTAISARMSRSVNAVNARRRYLQAREEAGQ